MKPHVPGRWAAQRLGTWVPCASRFTCTPRVTRRLRAALETEAEAFGRFIDRPAEVRIVP